MVRVGGSGRNGVGDVVATTALSDTWFEEALALVQELPVRPGLDGAVQFEAGDIRWHQVITDGRVTAWARGELPDAQLSVRMPMETALAAHRPGADGSALLATCTVVRADGTEELPAPLDLLAQPALEALPLLRGADLTVQYHLANGPFGDVRVCSSFVDGRLVEMVLDEREDPDVEIWVSFRAMAALRSGTATILELLADGARFEGGEGPLMLFAGLEEGPELQAAKRSCGPSAAVLGVLGEVRADPAFQAALTRLAGSEA